MGRSEARLETRLAWRLAALMVAVLALSALAMSWLAVATARSMDDAALQVEARMLAHHLRAGPDGRPSLELPAGMRRAFRRSDDESLYVVADSENHPLLTSDPRRVSLVAPFLPVQPGIFRVPPNAHYRDGLVGAMVSQGPWHFAVAQAREQGEALANTLMQHLLGSSLMALLPIGLAAVLIAVVTVRRGLRPLRQVAATAEAIDPAHPGTRLTEFGLPGEVRPLVVKMNAALARLEVALDAQRRFVGDVAHALRTPLAVLTARLDSVAPTPETRSLKQDAARLVRLVEQMLKMARVEASPRDMSQPVLLREIAVEVISLLAPAALNRGIELLLTDAGTPVRVTGSRTALAIALTNLVENAVEHAPAGSTVEVAIVPPAALHVADRGPGIPIAERARIFGRFQRGSGATPHGAGLGLAIVAEIAAAHQGRVGVTERQGGGSVFILDLAVPSAAGEVARLAATR